MLQKLGLPLFFLMLLMTACKKGAPVPLDDSPIVLASEPTPITSSSSVTIAPKVAATSPAVSPSIPTSIPDRSSASSTPIVSINRTNTPTSTPWIPEVTLTPTLVEVEPTRLPTITLLPEFSGFTSEELVNQGMHKFSVACQAWGACVCDSTRTVSPVTVVIEFTEGVVNISEPGGSFYYAKQAPSQYVLTDQDAMLEIFFRLDGFQVYRTEVGAACLLYTYVRDVSPQ